MPELAGRPLTGEPEAEEDTRMIAALERRFASAGPNPASRALLHAMIIHRLQQVEAAREASAKAGRGKA